MKCFVGTSGWYYDWNEEKNLGWYVENSGLNAVELNMSFYRFPYPNQVKGWAKHDLMWSVKVNRRITHLSKFGSGSIEIWNKFKKLFEPLDERISFFLLQLPPSFKTTSWNKLERFIIKTKEERFAIEFRSDDWFEDRWVERVSELGTFVSVDSPKISYITSSRGKVYLRMHGRSSWYAHNYSDEELKEIVEKIWGQNPKEAYVFFNNDHDMLNNARRMKVLLCGKKG